MGTEYLSEHSVYCLKALVAHHNIYTRHENVALCISKVYSVSFRLLSFSWIPGKCCQDHCLKWDNQRLIDLYFLHSPSLSQYSKSEYYYLLKHVLNEKLIALQHDVMVQDAVFWLGQAPYMFLPIGHFLLFHISMMSAYLENEREFSTNISDYLVIMLNYMLTERKRLRRMRGAKGGRRE